MTDIVKITSPAKPLQVVNKINEVVDGINNKQDKLVSGNNIKTINNTSLLGSGNIEITTGSTYTQGTGISIVNNTINHSNSITAGTVGTSSATSGSTLAVPYINYDSEGHITGKGTHTHTVTGFLTSNDVTPNYSQTGTDPINGTGVKKALDTLSIPTVTSTYTATGTDAVNGVAVSNAIATKQDNLVSGTNIKTINGTSILGSGNITIETSSTPNVDGETISYNTNDALQTIAIKNVRDGSTLPIWQGTEQQWNQGGSSTWYYWQTSETAMWTSGGSLPSVSTWSSVTYGDGKFVAINTSGKAAYSIDGINWTETTLLSSAILMSVTYGNGKFVAVGASDKSMYSTDGINWTETTLGSNAWYSVTYGNGKFVTVAMNSDVSAYSTDGINWTASTLPSMEDWISVTYGDGKFVATGSSTIRAAYSTDGINWSASSTLPSMANWNSVTYGGGKFVAVVSNSTKAAYSTDGINWTASTLPSSANWGSLTYGDGKFVAITNGSDKSIYSTDGINWTETTLPSSAKWRAMTYGDDKFIALLAQSDASAIFTMSYDKCYTDTANPTTSSTVYSAPEVISSYTISSITSGAITLSNNNTYYYNQSGNAFTYRTIGDAHPEYLAFIDGVGVKMGNTLIASATPITTSITSTSTDAEAPSAKAVYDEVGDVESALNTINSGGVQTATLTVQVYDCFRKLDSFTINGETYTDFSTSGDVGEYKTKDINIPINTDLPWTASVSSGYIATPNSGTLNISSDYILNLDVDIDDDIEPV